MSSPDTIEQLVRYTTVGDAFPKRDQRELVTIPSSCTIQDAIHVLPNLIHPPCASSLHLTFAHLVSSQNNTKILAEAKVLSAPVQDKSGGYLGLVDMYAPTN